MTRTRTLGVLLLALGGCSEDVIDLDPLDTTPVVEASVRPAPIVGGTLTITASNQAIAADPDRDVVYVVDLNAQALRHAIALEPGDQPGRVVVGADGRAHVVLRGFGGLATIDPDAGVVTSRQRLCPEPRGVAVHETDGSLYVACSGGALVHLSSAGEELERRELEPDLRDVLIVDGAVMVSVFREAAIVGLDGARIELPEGPDDAAHVAWRTWVTADGEIAMLHQVASKKPVPIDPDPDELPPGGSAYGGGDDPCQFGLVSAAVTTIGSEGVHTTTLMNSRLTVDAAFSPDGERVALAVPGAVRPEPPSDDGGGNRLNGGVGFEDFGFLGESGSTLRVEPKDGTECFTFTSDGEAGQVTAVAYDTSGRLVSQSREPARLLIMDDEWSPPAVIELGGESRFDTGHEIFHRATDSGLSCASCHPEGTDDGHVWEFDDLGPRRTQALDVGLRDTAPFHWDGDMETFDTLMSEVLAHRMGGKRQSPERADSFTRWVFDQQRPAADDGRGDAALVAQGEALFAAHACDKCHDGPALGGQRTERVSGVAKQVPTLRRVSLHPPFMHDGRAHTLEDAVRDMIDTTSPIAGSDADVEALTAYLRTL
ncbi:MAG: c-type cytochrome [Nannocystaceae bacterium]